MNAFESVQVYLYSIWEDILSVEIRKIEYNINSDGYDRAKQVCTGLVVYTSSETEASYSFDDYECTAVIVRTGWDDRLSTQVFDWLTDIQVHVKWFENEAEPFRVGVHRVVIE